MFFKLDVKLNMTKLNKFGSSWDDRDVDSRSQGSGKGWTCAVILL